MRRGGAGDDDGGLADFLGASSGVPSSQAAQGRGGSSGSGGAAGDGADRYGLFTTNTGATGGGSRVSQSRARYDTLFGEVSELFCCVFCAGAMCCMFLVCAASGEENSSAVVVL